MLVGAMIYGHKEVVTQAIPTSTIQLQPWLMTSNVESCFPTLDGGHLILKDRGKTLLNESLSVVRLQDKPSDVSFWTTHAQRLPDGGYALASSRSTVGEKNIQLFDKLGKFKMSFAVGDGIEHLTVDSKGRIWVGYFDEGIFGADPLSSGGLSRFSQSGKLEYQWSSEKNDIIADCDALTVDDRDLLWICAHPQYFLATVTNDDTQILLPRSPVSMPCGLLTSTTHVGFLGGIDYHGNGDKPLAIIHYEPEGPRLEFPLREGPEPTDKESVVTIVNLQTGDRTQVQVFDENATPLIFRNRVNCRAGLAVCWTKDRLYRFTLESLMAA
jgi:hypothetical protein